MARSKTAKIFRIVCQFCKSYGNHAKNLDMEYVCRACGKYAKYRHQKMKKITILNTSHKKVLDLWQVVKVSIPCTVCGELTPIDKTCCTTKQELAN